MSFLSVLPTVIAPVALAGETLHASWYSLPAATTTVTPCIDTVWRKMCGDLCIKTCHSWTSTHTVIQCNSECMYPLTLSTAAFIALLNIVDLPPPRDILYHKKIEKNNSIQLLFTDISNIIASNTSLYYV